MQMKTNDQRTTKKSGSKRKSKRRRKKTKKLIKKSQQSSQFEEKSLSKDPVKLKTLHMFEPWIKRDELDVRNLFEINH